MTKEELEVTNKKISDECHKLVNTLEKKQNENVELIGKVAFTKNALNNAKAQIEKMKSDVLRNIKWADQNKNEQMYCKLNAMINQWEIRENDKRRT